MRTARALLVALVASGAAAAEAHAVPAELRDGDAGVTAILRGDAEEHDRTAGVLRRVRGLTVEVSSPGVRRVIRLPPCRPDCLERDGLMSATLHVVVLDSAALPEVLVERFADGTVCCTLSLTVLRLSGGTWSALPPMRPGSSYRLRDVGGSAAPEIIGDDARFAFGPRVLGVFAPLRVWRYRDGAFTDVTRAERALLRVSRRELLRDLRRMPRLAVPAVLPAVLATDHLLGAHRTAERRLRDHVRRRRISAAEGRRIRRFLRRTGYCRGCRP